MNQDHAPLHVYGVIDLARAPGLYEHVARLAPQGSRCLYEGRLDPRVVRVCPHVVELAEHDPLSDLWRHEGWGRSWGLLMQSRASLQAVRRRLRHFTQAKLPDGQGPVLFRFWDPRVFRVYFPLVEPEQLGEWFRDIDAYIVEDEAGAGLTRFSLDGGRLVTQAGPRPGPRHGEAPS